MELFLKSHLENPQLEFNCQLFWLGQPLQIFSHQNILYSVKIQVKDIFERFARYFVIFFINNWFNLNNSSNII